MAVAICHLSVLVLDFFPLHLLCSANSWGKIYSACGQQEIQ